MKTLFRRIITYSAAILVSAWAAASLYFTLAGRDIPGDGKRECMPDAITLSPEENAFYALRYSPTLIPDNKTPLCVNYTLRKAYLDGTTNRVALAAEAQAYLSAESNTLYTANRILASKGMTIPLECAGQLSISMPIRIGNVYRVKATYEASTGNLAAGRQSLMDLYSIGRFLRSNAPMSIMTIIGGELCDMSIREAATPLFAPEDDESWRARLRELARSCIESDKEDAKQAARQLFASLSNALTVCATNRADLSSDFPASILKACPGYLEYSFQPNRSIEMTRTDMENFCRKLDSDGYDAVYANETASRIHCNPLANNWFGHKLRGSVCSWHEYYAIIYRARFRMNANVAILACHSYMAKYGSYPTSLDALVPEFLSEVPSDPFDGEKMHYDSADFFVWTPGKLLNFDGKVKRAKNRKPFVESRFYQCIRFLDPR